MRHSLQWCLLQYHVNDPFQLGDVAPPYVARSEARRLFWGPFRSLQRPSFLERFLRLALVVLFLFVLAFRHETPPASSEADEQRASLYADV